MSEKPPHEQAADLVRDSLRADRDKAMRFELPSNPLQKGPLDWYIGMGLVFGAMGLLQGHGETWAGLLGVAVGVGIVGLWNLFLFVVTRILGALFGRRPKETVKPRTYVSQDKGIDAYFRNKRKKK